MNRIILLMVFLFSATGSRSQVLTNLGLGVTDYKDTSNEILLQQLQTADEDSNKVKLLLRICSYYFRNVESNDSVLYFSKQAMKLSLTLGYKTGYNEACFLQCKTNAKKGNITDAKKILLLVSRDQQARLLLVLGEHYLFLPGEQKNNLDSGYSYLRSALLLSEAIQNIHWKHESLVALGKYYFSAGDFNQGKESFMKVIRYYQNNGDKKTEARWWYDLALFMPSTDSTLAQEVDAFEHALLLNRYLKDTSETAEVMFDLAGIYRISGRYDSAKQFLNSAISLLKAIHKKKVYKFYLLMSYVCQAMGDLDEALNYTLEALNNVEATGERVNIPVVYYQLGDIYASLGQHENSLKYFLSAKDKMNFYVKYYAYAKASEQLIQLQRPREALQLLVDFEKKEPPERLVDKETISGAKADCYLALHEYSTAEKYYLQMISLDVLAQKNRSKVLFSVESISGPEAYYKIGKFYVDQKKYVLAQKYLSKSLQTSSFDDKVSYSTELLRNIKWMQFKADSATGNYFSALQNFQQYTVINDSIFNSGKIKEAEKMRIAFETKEKEKNIELLQKEKLIQQGSLNQTTLAKNVAIAGIIFLMILLGLLYRQFKIKQLNNRTISYKNEILGSLLIEKEWLLKEIHHRVKNNLQIMISLLNTQSNYLESDAAIKAIRESQERMQAISLIHQKLYTSDDTGSINIKEYIRDLISHLRNGFSASTGIVFDLNIVDYQLDVAQAVPLGLILNEAVSNIFKYAFPGKSYGSVAISVIRSADNESLLLTIIDNGIGLPSDYDVMKRASFGIRLMQGLSKQMGGDFKIENNNGVKIEVSFTDSKLMKLIRNKKTKETVAAEIKDSLFDHFTIIPS